MGIAAPNSQLHAAPLKKPRPYSESVVRAPAAREEPVPCPPPSSEEPFPNGEPHGAHAALTELSRGPRGELRGRAVRGRSPPASPPPAGTRPPPGWPWAPPPIPAQLSGLRAPPALRPGTAPHRAPPAPGPAPALRAASELGRGPGIAVAGSVPRSGARRDSPAPHYDKLVPFLLQQPTRGDPA